MCVRIEFKMYNNRKMSVSKTWSYRSCLLVASLAAFNSNVCEDTFVSGLQITKSDFEDQNSTNSEHSGRNDSSEISSQNDGSTAQEANNTSVNSRGFNPFSSEIIEDESQSMMHCGKLLLNLLSEYNDEIRVLESDLESGSDRVQYGRRDNRIWRPARIPMSKMAPVLECIASSRAYMLPTDGNTDNRGAPSREEFFTKAAEEILSTDNVGEHKFLNIIDALTLPKKPATAIDGSRAWEEMKTIYIEALVKDLSFYNLSRFRNALWRLITQNYDAAVRSGKKRILIGVPYYNFAGGLTGNGKDTSSGPWSDDLLLKSNLWLIAHAYQLLRTYPNDNPMIGDTSRDSPDGKGNCDFEFLFYGPNGGGLYSEENRISDVISDEEDRDGTVEIWNFFDASYSGSELHATIDRFEDSTEDSNLVVKYLVPIIGEGAMRGESRMKRRDIVFSHIVPKTNKFFVQWKAADKHSTGMYYELGQAILPKGTPYNQDHDALAINNLSDSDYHDYIDHPSQASWTHTPKPVDSSTATQDQNSNSSNVPQEESEIQPETQTDTNSSTSQEQIGNNGDASQQQIDGDACNNPHLSAVDGTEECDGDEEGNVDQDETRTSTDTKRCENCSCCAVCY